VEKRPEHEGIWRRPSSDEVLELRATLAAFKELQAALKELERTMLRTNKWVRGRHA